ncbi:helix-hairpin-helix domain-containing protein [Streptococcus dentiloxodontae]
MLENIIGKLKSNKLTASLAVVSAVLLIILLITYSTGNQTHESSNAYADLTAAASQTSSDQSSSQVSHEAGSSKVTVDVKGAVKNPGVYTLKANSRVMDAVEAAGGLTETADANSVNLAANLSDEAVIYVAAKGENISVVTSSSASSQETDSSAVSEQNDDKINLNTATAEELQTVSGIGEKKAADIIAYREENGGFKSVDELKNISGIGDKTFEKIKESVYVD